MITKPPLPEHIICDRDGQYCRLEGAHAYHCYLGAFPPADLRAIADHIDGHATIALPVEAVEVIRAVLKEADHDARDLGRWHESESICAALALLPEVKP